MALNDPALDNNVGANWGTSTETFGAGDFGTPGFSNIPAPIIVINEIMQNPGAVADGEGEWFEIFNAEPTDVNIDGWTISDNDTDSHVITNGGPLIIPAGGYLVLGNNADFSTNGGVNIDYQYSGFILANGADEVVLTMVGNVEIDRVEYDDGSTFPDPNGASMALIDPVLDNNIGSNWEASSTPFGDGDLGTPGATNATDPEINIVGINIQDIVSGDSTSSPLDGTDFGSADVLTGGSVTRVFTVENTGGAILTLGANAVTLGGADAGAFTVNIQPATTVSGVSSTTFEITFDPSRAGRHDATVTVSSDDADESSYTFAIEANGTVFRNLSATPTLATEFAAIGGSGSADGLLGAEISAYDAASKRLFVTSGSGLQIVNLSDPMNPSVVGLLKPSANGASDDEVTSVAVNGAGIVAVAVPGADTQTPGDIFFYNAATGVFLGAVQVGALPDMVTFAGATTVLVANEGEPGGGSDPEGSVSIIDISGGIGAAAVSTATFTVFNGTEDALRAAGVKITHGKTAAEDFEPEYIAISPDGTMAWVTLQENNAIAVVDIATAAVVEIIPLGLKDHSMPFAQIDPTNNSPDALTLGSHPIWGMYMPDAVASYQTGGMTYYITANEGDSRSAEETEIGDEILEPLLFTDPSFRGDNGAGELEITNLFGDVDGDGDFDKLHAFGARSFSIYDANGEMVFDSGDVLARATDALGLYPDGRSDNKGTEPEGVTVGLVDGRWLAFVGLERANAVAIFDVSDPVDVSLVQVLNNTSDVSPEGLTFIAAADSPNGKDLLVVSNEVSNTIRIYSTFDTKVGVDGNGTLSHRGYQRQRYRRHPHDQRRERVAQNLRPQPDPRPPTSPTPPAPMPYRPRRSQ